MTYKEPWKRKLKRLFSDINIGKWISERLYYIIFFLIIILVLLYAVFYQQSYRVISVIVIFHLLDFYFTIAVLDRYSKVFKNAHSLEYNPARYFFKWFGIKLGGLFYLPFSLSAMILIPYFALKDGNSSTAYVFVGACMAMAYANFRQYFDRTKLEKR